MGKDAVSDAEEAEEQDVAQGAHSEAGTHLTVVSINFKDEDTARAEEPEPNSTRLVADSRRTTPKGVVAVAAEQQEAEPANHKQAEAVVTFAATLTIGHLNALTASHRCNKFALGKSRPAAAHSPIRTGHEFARLRYSGSWSNLPLLL